MASDHDLRRFIPTLRRLLVHDDIGKVWRELGMPKQPKIRAPDISKMLRDTQTKTEHVVRMIAGGLIIENIQLAGLGACLAHNPTTGKGPGDESGFSVPVFTMAKASSDWRLCFFATDPSGQFTTEWHLTEYLKSASGLIWGKEITRRDIIMFHANYLDGGHPPDGAKPKNQKKYGLALGLSKAFFKPPKGPERDGVYLELLAICQCVSSSDDIARLHQVLENEVDSN